MNQNNSAHRLFTILEKATQIGGNEKDTSAVIGKAMDIQDISNRCFMTDFFTLISDVEKSISHLKNVPKKNRYLGAIQEIQNLFFSYSLIENWPSISSTIESRNLITVLDACATFISTEDKLLNLDETQLEEYLSQCEDILSKVKRSYGQVQLARKPCQE